MASKRSSNSVLELKKSSETDKSDNASKKRNWKFDTLMELLSGSDISFFHDQFKAPWACLKFEDHYENVRIGSELFRQYLTGLFYEATGEGCGRETVRQAQDTCSAKARFAGACRPLSYRTAKVGDRILIDLGWEDWTAVEVSAAGWKLIRALKEPPFRRHSHMQPLPEPEPGGRVQDILKILPIKDETARVLLSVWLPTVFVPNIGTAAILLTGLQGSGKTFVSEILRQLIDPSVVRSLSLPTDQNELIQALDHHYLPAFDNCPFVPPWASDILCRATTGLGHTKRQLYSDDDDFPYFIQRSFILNGISLNTRPDLADRTLTIELDRIEDTDRRSTRELLAEFYSIQPKALGGCLDALVEAMRLRPTMQHKELPRLADWAEWAIPVAEAIGVGKEAFVKALKANIAKQHSDVNESEPVALAVIDFMDDKTEWSGTAANLVEKLQPIGEDQKLNRESNWPKAPNALSKRLKAITHNLKAAGIQVSFIREGDRKGTRLIKLTKVSQDPGKSSEASDCQKDNDIVDIGSDNARAVYDDRRPTSVRNTDRHISLQSLASDDTDGSDDIYEASGGHTPGNTESNRAGFACHDCTEKRANYCYVAAEPIDSLDECPRATRPTPTQTTLWPKLH